RSSPTRSRSSSRSAAERAGAKFERRWQRNCSAARTARRRSRKLLTGNFPNHSRDRIVELVDDALFERNDRVVGDVDVLGADLRAALRDVAEAEAHSFLQ